jgi:hypothetical protein
MVIVEVRPFSKIIIRLGSDCFQLATGKAPFPESTDVSVTVMVTKGKRPPKPLNFDAPGMSSAIWKIAKKCWHQKAKERPEINVILKHLENLVNLGPGVCTHNTSLYLEWGAIDPQIWQITSTMTSVCQHRLSSGGGRLSTAEHHSIGERDISLRTHVSSRQCMDVPCLTYRNYHIASFQSPLADAETRGRFRNRWLTALMSSCHCRNDFDQFLTNGWSNDSRLVNFEGIGKRGIVPYLNFTKMGFGSWNQLGHEMDDHRQPPQRSRGS